MVKEPLYWTLLENKNFAFRIGEKTKASLIRANTVEAKVGLEEKGMPDASIVGHQLGGHLVGKLKTVTALFQGGKGHFLNLTRGCFIETCLCDDKITNVPSAIQGGNSTEAKLKEESFIST